MVLLRKNINIIKNKKGFTMLEILTIVVIIGILAGAILVSMKGIREDAEKKSLMRTMGTIVRAAGACNEINRVASPQGELICNPTESNNMTYPTLDSKLTAKGYIYGWSGNDLIGLRGTDQIVRCYVGSGMCEGL